MRKTIRNILIFMICLFSIIPLSACKEKVSRNSSQADETNQSNLYYSSYDDTHISTKLSSGVEVNANVVLSNTVSLNALSIYDARIAIQDFDKVKELLLGKKKIIENVTQETKESLTDSPFRYCRTSDDFSLASSGQNIYFNGSLYDKVSSLVDYNESGNSELFLTGENLNFASIEAAKKEINELLKQLNISVLDNPICYTLDYKTLLNESKIYNKAIETNRNDLFKQKPISIEKSDECYIFLYQLSFNGLPVSTNTSGVFGDGSWMSGTSVLCTYSADGLVSLKMDYQFQDAGENAQPSKGMEVGQALEKLDQKYNSILLEGKYLVDHIEFEYFPMPKQGKSNHYTLIPAWRFSILHTNETPQKENSISTMTVQQRITAVFHAVTGNELLIDFGNA